MLGKSPLQPAPPSGNQAPPPQTPASPQAGGASRPPAPQPLAPGEVRVKHIQSGQTGTMPENEVTPEYEIIK